MDGRTEEIFYGETQCQMKYNPSGSFMAKQCSHKAYYKQGSKYLCGVHSKASNRQKLLKNPNAKQHKEENLKRFQSSVDDAREKNKKMGKLGSVICSKLRMMKSPEDIPGYLKVFPNAKHQNRKDGFGCASLSPKVLGPVNHLQKGLPQSLTLENYHQYNKVFPSETTRDRKPSEEFYKKQKMGYKAKEGHRHKKSANIGNKKERPLYSIHRDKNGNEQQYTYVQSRYLYCHFYEILAKKSEDFGRLEKMIKFGTNLQIVGFDGYEVNRDLMSHYLDTSKPFGHEMCLYTMLTVSEPKDYPWNRYYWGHKNLYPSYLSPSHVDDERGVAEETSDSDDAGGVTMDRSETDDSE